MAIFKCYCCEQTKVLAGPSPSNKICATCEENAPILIQKSEISAMRHRMLLAGWNIASYDFNMEAIRRVLAEKLGAATVHHWSRYDLENKVIVCEGA